VRLPRATAEALDAIAAAEGSTPAGVVERLVAEEAERLRRAGPAACTVCGKPVPASRAGRRTCSARCTRRGVARRERFVVVDGVRRVSAHAKEADAEAVAERLRELQPRRAASVRVEREEV
jgi:hypothetical protein